MTNQESEIADTLAPLSESEQIACEQLDQWIEHVHLGNQPNTKSNALAIVAKELCEVGNQVLTLGVGSGITSLESDDQDGPSIEGYEITKVIGRGGMGVVYQAVDLTLKRNVALKVLPKQVVGSVRARKRFQVEVQAAAQLEHPAIVPVYSFGEYAGGMYYTMREVVGLNLAQKLALGQVSDPKGPGDERSDLPTAGPAVDLASTAYHRWVASAGKQIAEALSHSHTHLIVHRDIKPANIMIDTDGKPLLSDFGLARISDGTDLTNTGDVMGTIRYMSPEQTAGIDVVDARSDVYSLGVTIYEALTGKPAIEESGFTASLKKITEGRIVPPRQLNPSMELDLETIVLKSIALEPERRYANAQALADDLGRYLDDQPVHARRATVGLKVSRWARRNRRWVASLVSVVSLLMIVIFGLTVQQARQSSRDATRIRQQTAALLDVNGIERLKKGEAKRAAEFFAQSAQMGSDRQTSIRQRRRVQAIEQWSPQRIDTAIHDGQLIARFKPGTKILRQLQGEKQVCLYVDGNELHPLFETDRVIEYARCNKAKTKAVIVIGDRTNKRPTIKIFDVEEHKLSTVPIPVEWKITDIWFADDEQSLITTGWGGTVSKFDIRSGELLKESVIPISGQITPWVYASRSNRSQSEVVVAANPGQVLVYQLSDLEPIWESPKKLDGWMVDALAITDDAQWVAAGTAEDKMHLWHVPSGIEVRLGSNVAGKPTVAMFSPDGRHLAVGDNRGDVYLWEMPQLEDGKPASRSIGRRGYRLGHEFAIVTLDFGAQNNLLVGCGNQARVWRLSDFQPLTPLLEIPDTQTLRSATWTTDDQVRLRTRMDGKEEESNWNLPDAFRSADSDRGRLLGLFASEFEGVTEGVSINDQSENSFLRVSLSSSSNRVDSDPSRNVVQASVIELGKPLVGSAFALSGNEQKGVFLTWDRAGTWVNVVDRATLEEQTHQVQDPNYLKYPRMNETGDKWIANDFQGHIVVGDIGDQAIEHSIVLPQWVVDARLIHDNQFAAICWDYRLRIWSQSGSEVAQFEQEARPELLQSIDGMLVVAASDQLYVYQQEGAERWRESFRRNHRGGQIQNVAINADGSRWLSCNSNGSTKLWSANGETIKAFTSQAPIFEADFSEDGKWLAVLDETGTLSVRDGRTGELMGPSIHGKTPIEYFVWTKKALKIAGNNFNRAGFWIAEVALPENWLTAAD